MVPYGAPLRTNDEDGINVDHDVGDGCLDGRFKEAKASNEVINVDNEAGDRCLDGRINNAPAGNESINVDNEADDGCLDGRIDLPRPPEKESNSTLYNTPSNLDWSGTSPRKDWSGETKSIEFISQNSGS